MSNTTLNHSQQKDHAFRLLPVSTSLYDQVVKDSSDGNVTMLEITTDSKLFDLISRYVTLHGRSSSWAISQSIITVRADPFSSAQEGEEDGEMSAKRWQSQQKVDLRLGLGYHPIEFEGRPINVFLQAIGDPVGSEGGVHIYESMVLFTDGAGHQSFLHSFCNFLLEWEVEKTDHHYNIYMWNPRCMRWNKMATKRVRPVESVILPERFKTLVLEDLSEFDSVSTARWYAKHGVPYKRSCIFYGPPGTGKTSFITALAGALNRNVCFLQPAHPMITDDNLQQCIQNAPAHSIIVMEDVDALFTADRKSASSDTTPLTFSGMLNALDGLCNPEGQIFILTTNHIDRLDPALIRPGRVDVKVKFTSSSRQQVAALFEHFYPGQSKLAQEFADVIAKRFPVASEKATTETVKANDTEEETKVGEDQEEEELGISMAALQQHFILCRKNTSKETLDKVHSFSI